MNRVKIAAICCVLSVLVLLVFLGGEREKRRRDATLSTIIEHGTSIPEPVIVKKPSTESQVPEDTGDGSASEEVITETDDPPNPEQQRQIEEKKRIIRELERERDTLIAELRQSRAEEKAEQEAAEQVIRDMEPFMEWIRAEFNPKMKELRPDIEFFIDLNVLVSPAEFDAQFPNYEDKVYHANKLSEFQRLYEEYVARAAQLPQSTRQQFIDYLAETHGDKAEELIDNINKKAGEL